jgi:hypothetical protein
VLVKRYSGRLGGSVLRWRNARSSRVVLNMDIVSSLRQGPGVWI